MTTQAEALNDLKAKIKALTDDIALLAQERLEKVEKAGAGLTDQHLANDLNNLIPKMFICALSDEIESQYSMHRGWTKKERQAIKDIWLLM